MKRCFKMDWRGALCPTGEGFIAPNAWCTRPRGHVGWCSQDADGSRKSAVVYLDAAGEGHLIPETAWGVFLPRPSPADDAEAALAAIARSDAIEHGLGRLLP